MRTYDMNNPDDRQFIAQQMGVYFVKVGNEWYSRPLPKRIDKEGRDVTLIPGLWDESDRFITAL